jgi:hypothetical protein
VLSLRNNSETNNNKTGENIKMNNNLNAHIRAQQVIKLKEHHEVYQRKGNQQSGKATYDLGEDYTDLLKRIAILHRTSKTQLIRDLLNQEAHELGGSEVLYPETKEEGR